MPCKHDKLTQWWLAVEPASHTSVPTVQHCSIGSTYNKNGTLVNKPAPKYDKVKSSVKKGLTENLPYRYIYYTSYDIYDKL